MKAYSHLLVALAVLLLGWEASACTNPDPRRESQARAGLEELLRHQPEITGFTTVGVEKLSGSVENDRGAYCYSAAAHMILGSRFSNAEAADEYLRALQLSGWVAAEPRAYNQGVLVRGSHERLAVDTITGYDSTLEEMGLNYATLSKEYETILWVFVQYLDPGWKEC